MGEIKTTIPRRFRDRAGPVPISGTMVTAGPWFITVTFDKPLVVQPVSGLQFTMLGSGVLWDGILGSVVGNVLTVTMEPSDIIPGGPSVTFTNVLDDLVGTNGVSVMSFSDFPLVI